MIRFSYLSTALSIINLITLIKHVQNFLPSLQRFNDMLPCVTPNKAFTQQVGLKLDGRDNRVRKNII